MNNQLLLMIKLKLYLVFILHYKRSQRTTLSKDNPGLTFELFFKMAESAFWWDEQVTTNMTFQAMTKSDMAGSDIPHTADRKTTTRRKTKAISKH